MPETGVVVASRDRRVDVRLAATEGCSHCGACAADGDARLMSDVENRLGASLGDTVEVDFREGVRARLAVLAYVPPVAGLALGYLAGSLLGRALGADADSIGALGALACGIGAIAAVKPLGAALESRALYRPQVRAIIARASSPSGPGRDQAAQ